MTTTSKPHKLDVFKTLERINLHDRAFFSTLTEEEQNGFLPVVVMQWMAGSNKPLQLMLLNSYVNPYVFSLTRHKGLLYKLMALSSAGPQRATWIKSEAKKSKVALCIEVIQAHYGYNKKHAIDAFPLLSNDVILQMAARQGRQSDELAKVKSELKNR